VGTLGLEKNKKLVPTRWSITAVDDLLGKELFNDILYYPIDCDYTAYYSSFQGNYFMILFFPGPWAYELFEIPYSFSEKKQDYTTDAEHHLGRKSYADQCAGGYYAARLGILELFKKKKKQGQCLILRFISNEYQHPLGVWVVREAVRNTLETKPITFSDKSLLLKYVKEKIKRSWGVNTDYFYDKSLLLQKYQKQTTLGMF